MSAERLLRVGILGAVVTALCCFTPRPVVLLGMFGLAALLGWLDHLLIPALVLSLIFIGDSLWTRTRTSQPRPLP